MAEKIHIYIVNRYNAETGEYEIAMQPNIAQNVYMGFDDEETVADAIGKTIQKGVSNAGDIRFPDGETLQEKFDTGGGSFMPTFELYINADGELIAVTEQDSVPLRIDEDGYLIYMEG